jgi:hypothetical protein
MDRSVERISASGGPGSGSSPVLSGAVAGLALFRARPPDLPALRRRPGPVPEAWLRTPPSLLRYADEQTVTGTAAVFAAMATMGARPEGFEGWGVVAASRYLGRASLAAALRSFKAEGVWGTSPHLIPHFALHSPSGTISLALGLHGPNLGIGGGLHSVAEGFLAAMTWLSAGVLPGVWLVLSGWSPELIPERRAVAVPAPAANSPADAVDIECRALAVALRPAEASTSGGPVVRLIFGGEAEPVRAPVDLVRLAEGLEGRGGPSPLTIATDPAGRLRVELVEGAGTVGSR